MIINVCGFGWSGSGAYLDLLREYEEVCFPTTNDWEFNFLWAPDGLYDLEQKLCYKHCRIFDSDLAIKRFLALAKEYGRSNGIFKYDKIMKTPFYNQCKIYIDNLVQFRLNAYTFNHVLHPTFSDRCVNFYNNLIEHLFCNRICIRFKGRDIYEIVRISNYKEMLISYMPENYREITQDFVASIFSQVRRRAEKHLVLNQSVPPDVPQLFDHYFKEDHKTIVVRRDPRDNYIIIKKLKGISRPVPTNVKDFILFYKKTIAKTIQPDSENLLSLSFEDLVYEYQETKRKIESFLGIKEHIEPFVFFDPSKSINNTQLVRLYPEFMSDIKLIEEELGDYLFPFDKYNYERTTNKVF